LSEWLSDLIDRLLRADRRDEAETVLREAESIASEQRRDRTWPNYGGCVALSYAAMVPSTGLAVIFDVRLIGLMSGRQGCSSYGQDVILLGFACGKEGRAQQQRF
jgi:hypothetical protein